MIIQDLNHLQLTDASVMGSGKKGGNFELDIKIKYAKVKQDAYAETKVKAGYVGDDLKAKSEAYNTAIISQ